MSSEPLPMPTPTPTPTWMAAIGWLISLLPALGLIASAGAKFMQPAQITQTFEKMGWPEGLLFGLGIVELACALIYLLPRTAVLGAVLLTGYLGGALATHLRVGDPISQTVGPVIFGVLIWLGLLLRDEHVRAVLPIRSGGSWLGLLPFVLVVIVLAAVIVPVVLQPDEYQVERSITIDAPAAEIFPHVNDFHKWDAWSPWLKIDPNATKTYEGPETGRGAVFRWKGNDEVGQGSMTILDSHPNDDIKIELAFLEPFRNTADTEFTFKEVNQKTVVTWKMHGHSNFAGKAFHLVMDMDKLIGDKYYEGLANLKKVVEAKK